MRKTIVSLLIGVLWSQAPAWDVSGHMIIAQLAYGKLTTQAKAKVDQLAGGLELNHQALNAVNVAAWADEIKHQRGGPYGGHYKQWHFIDMGCNAADPDPLLDPPHLSIQNGDVVTALNRCVAFIKRQPSDPLIPDDSVAVALIIHLVGDIHQPLHCTTHYYSQPKVEPGHKRPETSDAGGNAIGISNFHDRYPELHELWDVAYKASFSAGEISSAADLSVESTKPDGQAVKDAAAKVMTVPIPTCNNCNADFAAWAQETHALGCSQAYGTLSGDVEQTDRSLDATYVSAAHDLACKQMCLAAGRLADLLNDLFK